MIIVLKYNRIFTPYLRNKMFERTYDETSNFMAFITID